MTIAPQSPTEVAPTDLVTVSVDGIEVRVPKGMLVIRVAEEAHVLHERVPAHWEKVAVVAQRSIWRYVAPAP